MNSVTSPRAQAAIGVGSLLLGIGLIATTALMHAQAPATHQQSERFAARAAFDAGVDKSLNLLRGQEPFEITTMIMESKRRLRAPSPQERGLSFAQMKRHTRELLRTPGVESVSVFVVTRDGPQGSNMCLTWTKNGGLILRAGEHDSPAAAQDEPDRYQE